MSNITMDQVAVMGVQYFHYTLDYYQIILSHFICRRTKTS